MRRERKVNELKKDLYSYSRFASSKDLPSTEQTPHILHTIDYNKALIKELLK